MYKFISLIVITSVSCLPVALATEVPFYLRNRETPLPIPTVPHPKAAYVPGRIPYADWVIKQAASVASKLAECYKELNLYQGDTEKDKVNKSWAMKKISKKAEYLRYLNEKFQHVTSMSLADAGYDYENLMSGDPSRNHTEGTLAPVAMADKTSKQETPAVVKVEQTKDEPKKEEEKLPLAVKAITPVKEEGNPEIIAELANLEKVLTENHEFVCDVDDKDQGKKTPVQDDPKAVLNVTLKNVKEEEEETAEKKGDKDKDPEDAKINEVFSAIQLENIIDEKATPVQEVKLVDIDEQKAPVAKIEKKKAPKKHKETKVAEKKESPSIKVEEKKPEVVAVEKAAPVAKVEEKKEIPLTAPVAEVKVVEPKKEETQIVVKDATVSMTETKVETKAESLVVKDASIVPVTTITEDSVPPKAEEKVEASNKQAQDEMMAILNSTDAKPVELPKQEPKIEVVNLATPVVEPVAPAATPAPTPAPKVVELQAPQDVQPLPTPTPAPALVVETLPEIKDTAPLTAPLSIDAPAPAAKDEKAEEAKRVEEERKEFELAIDKKIAKDKSDKVHSDILKSIPVQAKKEEAREEKPQPVLEQKKDAPAPIIEAHPSGVITEEGEIQEANGPSY